VVLHFADGRIQVRDVSTGDVLSERSGVQVVPGGWRETVIGDNLYWTDPQGVMRASLTGSQAPTRLHTRAETDASTGVEPCGPELVCVSTRNDIVAIDGLGREAWRVTTPYSEALFVGGSGVAIFDDGTKSAVYDLRGNQLLPSEYQVGTAQWTDADNLLIFQPAGIIGYSLSRRKGAVLGENQVSGNCSWNATKLVCPTEKGISVWTYALS
jgi:hypothetical protein